MGKFKQMIQKAGEKKWGREEWVIMILAGIFLLIVFLPTSKKESENVGLKRTEAFEESVEDSVGNAYKEQMEKQLEDVLKSIDGIDAVSVMITLKTSEEEVVLKESVNVHETTAEEDKEGGKREIESESITESVCYMKDESEISVPYVAYTVSPKVEGVLIVVGGNKAATLRVQIVKAVQALFDVDSHKVVVIKMKES